MVRYVETSGASFVLEIRIDYARCDMVFLKRATVLIKI